MKVSALQQNCNNTRRSNSFRSAADSSLENNLKSPGSLFWLLLHGLCCLISLVLGFRFSRIVLFLLFSSAATTTTTTDHFSAAATAAATAAQTLAVRKLPSDPAVDSTVAGLNRTRSSGGVVVGRHGILIRPWPHPDPTEVMRAHRIIERVQREQRAEYGIKNPKTLIVVTPTYVRTFQRLHLTGLMHSLMLVPYDVVWVVVEAGGVTNETATVLEKSRLRFVHVGFEKKMPISWEDRHGLEARMRLRGLRVVREERLDGILMFADDSNMHSMELFDEVQSVKWFGALSIGILTHSGRSEDMPNLNAKVENEENFPVPVQGPACNSSGQLVGWHTFNSLPFAEKTATYIGDGATVLPRKLEWAGFVLNSRLLWKEAEGKPEWVRDLETLDEDGMIESPLSLLKDASFVEPLGNCGRKVMLWWLRVEARADSKFPPGEFSSYLLGPCLIPESLSGDAFPYLRLQLGWIIDPPLEVTVPAKRTPWPDAPPELPSDAKQTSTDDRLEKRPHKSSRTSRPPRHGSRKRKHESRMNNDVQDLVKQHDEKN
ncbi:hypothetical protein Sjap_017344 [Stephania japonica]|uniref:Glycosyltransferases n=1 Tax=Stephania japonica TaxID=461633 RepID=A0AAP0NJT6_9MAGN